MQCLSSQLVSKNSSPYVLKTYDTFSCRIISITDKVDIPHVVEPAQIVGESSIKVSFTAKTSGQYRIVLRVKHETIGGQEIFRRYLPGVKMDPH